MKVIRDLASLPSDWPGCIAAIGNFDGVHEGHQYLFNEVVLKAKSSHLPAAVITFEPTPAQYFKQEKQIRLCSFREKIRLLKRFDIDWVLALRFNATLAKQSAKQFIEQILVQGLGVQELWVGEDFHFGYQRRGDVRLLKQSEQSFITEVVADITIGGERVSSTAIRHALAEGDLALAERLLGYGYRMSGRVVMGDQRGRQWGIPTANIDLSRRGLPLRGVFCVEVYGLDDHPVLGVANCGLRPTVDGKRPLLEVHLFDFARDIYGQRIEVVFTHKIRDEMKFTALSALKAQILHDIEEAKVLLNTKEHS